MKIWPLILVTMFTVASLTCGHANTPLNRIVAVVNNSVITEIELETRLEVISQQIAQRGTSAPPKSVLKPQVLERLISDSLQLQLAEATGIRVDDETLNKTVARLAANNNLSVDQFRLAIENDGFSFTQFREDIRNEIIMRRLHERQIVQRAHASGTEIDQFLLDDSNKTGAAKEYHLAHILIALPEAPTPEQVTNGREKAEMIVNELKQGADFKQLAISYSDGQQALEGGDLGWRRGSELPTLFAKVAPRLAVGETSDIIRGPNGFHLVTVLEVQGGDRHISEQTLARHILVKTNTLVDDNTAASRLNDYRKRIQAGDEFATLAKEYSDDLGSAGKGGELGWSNPGDLVPEFTEVMNSLKPGEISTPFKSGFGWHIVEVLDRRQQDVTEEFKRREAQQILRQRKIEQETESWLLKLRDEAYVEIRL
jgi:peptidyl-prolyl cis-trans isomerase SurA